MIFGEEKGPEVISVVSKDVVFFHGGPTVRIQFCSSSESGANLIFGAESHR
jgi:hypothetical protein